MSAGSRDSRPVCDASACAMRTHGILDRILTDNDKMCHSSSPRLQSIPPRK